MIPARVKRMMMLHSSKMFNFHSNTEFLNAYLPWLRLILVSCPQYKIFAVTEPELRIIDPYILINEN